MTRRGLLLFSAMSVIWGIPYLFIRIAVHEVSPATLVLARTALASAILLPIAIHRREVGAVLRRWRWVLAFAVVEVGIPWLLMGTAEQTITSSLAGLLVAGVPLAAAVIAIALRSSDRMNAMGFVGLLIGLAGVAAIGASNLRASGWQPIAEMAICVVCYALGPVILARRLQDLSSVAVMGLSLLVVTLAYVPVVGVAPPRAMPSPAALVSMAVLALVCTALAFLLFGALIATLGPVRATIITYVNPVVAAILGALILGERLTVTMAIGFVLVVAGSVLANRRPTRVPS